MKVWLPAERLEGSGVREEDIGTSQEFRGTIFWGRIIAFWGLYWFSLIYGNNHTGFGALGRTVPQRKLGFSISSELLGLQNVMRIVR